MATVTPKPRLSRAETETRVASPLHQLRGIIRMYVSAEGAAAAALYLAVCFWLGIALDYGIFKITGLDWIQILHWGFRGVVLTLAVVGLVGLVAYKVVSRLLFDFRPSALALLLERRFPKLLGDRLITAVELADTKKAATYGYSAAMIEHTIQEAAELVGKAPVKDVFNWGRLIRYGVATVVLTIGAYLLVAVIYCGSQAAFGGSDNFGAFAARFNQVTGIWFERNVLLRDVPWPRRAMLVIHDFDGDEKRIGQDAPAQTLTVQAFKWVIADSSKPEGWRPMVWADVAGLAGSAPTLAQAGVPDRLVDARFGDVTVDEVEAFFNGDDAPTGSGAAEARETLGKLDTLAASISKQRTLRKLEIPDEVRLYYKGTDGNTSLNSMQAMEPTSNRRYTATLPELKERIKFWATGADYTTPQKFITVVPPPELIQLNRDEWHAAYLYYRLLGRSASTEALKGKRQEIRNQPVSLSGDTCRLDVPFGTDLELTGHLNVFEDQKKLEAKKPLGAMKTVRIKPIAGVKEGHPVEIVDARTFKVRFPSVTGTIDFAFEFTDENNVTGFRHVIIKPVEDAPPEVDVQLEVLRKTQQRLPVHAAGPGDVQRQGEGRPGHCPCSVRLQHRQAGRAAVARAAGDVHEPGCGLGRGRFGPRHGRPGPRADHEPVGRAGFAAGSRTAADVRRRHRGQGPLRRGGGRPRQAPHRDAARPEHARAAFPPRVHASSRGRVLRYREAGPEANGRKRLAAALPRPHLGRGRRIPTWRPGPARVRARKSSPSSSFPRTSSSPRSARRKKGTAPSSRTLSIG